MVDQKKPPRRAQHILRYASCKDVAMYAAAFVTVMVSGLNQPAQLIIFGNLLDSFNTADTAEAVRLVHFFALMYAVVGIQQLITITLQTALATRVAAAQARRCREKYFAAVLSRPISWFDQSDQGAVGASVLESTLAIQDGLGEKLTTALQGVFAFVFGLAVSLYYAWSLALVSVGALPDRRGAPGPRVEGREPGERQGRRRVGGRVGRRERSPRQRADRGGVRRRAPGDEPLRGGVRARGGRHPRCRRVDGRERGARLVHPLRHLGPRPVVRELPDPPGHEAPRLLQLPPRRVRRPPRAEQQVHLGRRRDDGLPLRALRRPRAAPGPPGHRRLPARPVRGHARLQDHRRGRRTLHRRRRQCQGGGAASVRRDDAGRRDHRVRRRPVQLPRAAGPARLRRALPRHPGGDDVRARGPSGCGKSTVVQLLLRFYEVSGGAVVVDGVDARTLDVATLRSKMGLVAQEPVLFTGTIFENIAYQRPLPRRSTRRS